MRIYILGQDLSLIVIYLEEDFNTKHDILTQLIY